MPASFKLQSEGSDLCSPYRTSRRRPLSVRALTGGADRDLAEAQVEVQLHTKLQWAPCSTESGRPVHAQGENRVRLLGEPHIQRLVK